MAELTTKFTIDSKQAEQASQKLDNLMRMLRTSTQDVQKELSRLMVDNTGKMRDNTKERDKGTQSIQEFRKEQRTQNFIVRESTQALSGAVFAMALFSSGNKSASATQKAFTESLLAGVIAQNASEFALYGLGKAGKEFGNRYEKMLFNLGKNAGALSAIIGVSVAGVSLLKGAIDSAAESDRKLNSFNTARLGVAIKNESPASLAARRSKIAEEIRLLEESKAEIPAGRFIAFRVKLQAKINNLLEDQKALTAAIAEKDAQRTSGTIAAMQAKLEDLQSDLKSATTKERILDIQKQIEAEQKKLNQELKTTTERGDQELDFNLRLRKSLAEAEADPDRRASLMRGIETEEKILEVRRRSRKGEIDSIQKQKEEDAILLASAHKMGEQQEDANDRRIANLGKQYDLAKITSEEYIKQLELQKSTASTEEKRLQIEKEILDVKQNEFKKQAESLSNLREGMGALQSGLNALGVQQDSVLTKIIQGMQVIIGLSNLINAMAAKKAKGEEGGAGDILSIIGNFLSFAALFDKGGHTGSGRANEVAGVVHRGEIVFEKPIVDKYGAGLMNLRSQLQQNKGFQSGGYTGAGGGMQPVVQVILQGTLSGQRFLRSEMPRYRTFEKKKKP